MVEGSKEKVTSFEQLHVWQYSQDVAVAVYKVVKIFPPEEKYGLSDQLRRSSSSISANIAEGFGRSSKKDKLHFMVIAYGSLLETKNFLYLCARLGYITQTQLDAVIEEVVICQKMLNGFKRALKA
jgi:four helix bundle protein